MKPELYIAGRFAFKQRSSTRPTFIILIAVIGIAVGTAALILTLSVVKGFSSSIEGKLIGFSSHMQFRQPDSRPFRERRGDMQAILRDPESMSGGAFLEKNLILRYQPPSASAAGKGSPVMLKGVESGELERFLGRYRRGEGRDAPVGEGTIGIYVGSTLAGNLGLQPGSRVLLAGVDGSASVGEMDGLVGLLSSLELEVGTVRGVYDTGLQEGFDDFMLIADLHSMQALFAPGMVTGYEARVRHPGELAETVPRIVSALGYPFYGYSVFERYANLFEWLRLQQNLMPLLILTITVVAVFNIISTLLVLIIEKTREIGMLSALGLEPGRISRVFMAQAFLTAFGGILLGNILALGLTLFELRFHLITLPEKSYFIKYVPLRLDPSDYLLVSLAVMAVTMLFAFIPARIASSLKPATALGT
ncbi:FtsX-like permease family protein [Chlorobium sp. N1]|uniref:ABC transporter permease n=1 Tax=Chlorobium sp. N1 TaxID=2491138 RepID=UPI00103AAB07|nr:FtsX-like permease family protein [Chlorobium sp. N1]TCD47391.1 ABC transporter permease [Chlorobium sp. N1]